MAHIKCSCLKCKAVISTCNISSHYEKCQINSCLTCQKNIHSNKKFCDSSCSAKYNNSNRTVEQLQATAASISKSLSNTYHYICQLCEEEKTTTERRRKLCLDCSNIVSPNKIRNSINVRNCPNCNKKEISLGRFQHKFCPNCRTITEYRGLCNFTHDLKLYPNEYDLSLLEVHGMFHPKKNPKGVSRDHMYSVHDGYHNKVDPSILKHPANCQIILQSDNTIKHSTSCITYEELIERIQQWNLKYN